MPERPPIQKGWTKSTILWDRLFYGRFDVIL